MTAILCCHYTLCISRARHVKWSFAGATLHFAALTSSVYSHTKHAKWQSFFRTFSVYFAWWQSFFFAATPAVFHCKIEYAGIMSLVYKEISLVASNRTTCSHLTFVCQACEMMILHCCHYTLLYFACRTLPWLNVLRLLLRVGCIYTVYTH